MGGALKRYLLPVRVKSLPALYKGAASTTAALDLTQPRTI